MSDNGASLRAQISTWLRDNKPVVMASEWGSSLEIDGVNVWDASISHLYLALLRHRRKEDGEHLPFMSRESTDSNEKLRRWSFGLQRRAQEFLARSRSAPIFASQVIFFPREPTHVQVQTPVAKSLRENGVCPLFVASRLKIVHQLNKLGIKPVYTDSFCKRENHAATPQIFQRYPWIELPGLHSDEPSTAVADIVRQTLATCLPLIKQTIDVTDHLVRTAQPGVLVVGNDLTVEGRVASLRAKALGIPTVCLMHGTTIDPLHAYHVADRLLVFGAVQQSHLVKAGVVPLRIRITGAPHMDNLPAQTGKIHSRLVQKIGLCSEHPMVLIASSGPGNSISLRHHLIMIESIMRLSSQMKKVTFVVKLHRKDKVHFYQQMQRRVENSRLRVVKDNAPGFPTSIFDWLQGCKLVLTGASTVALEAMLMDVPVISMDFAQELEGIDFIDAGATVHVRNEVELQSAVDNLLHNSLFRTEARRRSQTFIQRYYFTSGNSASMRTAEEIMKMGQYNMPSY